MRKQKDKTVVLPGQIWDGEKYAPISSYPGFIVYSDKILAEVLGVSQSLVGWWRYKEKIPFKMEGSFARYDVNAVIQALLQAGYKQNLNLKSKENDSVTI